MPRCWDCGADLVSDDLPVLRHRPAPALAVLVPLAIIGVVSGLGWLVVQGSDSAAPTTVLPAVVSVSPAAGGALETTDPTPSVDAATEQATAVNDLLSESQHVRSSLGDAIDRVRRCDSSGDADIRQIAETRSSQLASAKDLQVDSLSHGAELKAALVAAFAASYDADSAYLAAADRYLGAGCVGLIGSDPGFQLGDTTSQTATARKVRFLELWGPIARAHDFPSRSSAKI
jgi:hypothetical protein